MTNETARSSLLALAPADNDGEGATAGRLKASAVLEYAKPTPNTGKIADFHDRDATAGGGCATAIKFEEQAALEEYDRVLKSSDGPKN